MHCRLLRPRRNHHQARVFAFQAPWPLGGLGGGQSGALSTRLGFGSQQPWMGVLGDHRSLNKGSEAGRGEVCSLITLDGFDGFGEKDGIISGLFH